MDAYLILISVRRRESTKDEEQKSVETVTHIIATENENSAIGRMLHYAKTKWTWEAGWEGHKVAATKISGVLTDPENGTIITITTQET